MPIHSRVSLLRSPTISMMLFYKTDTSTPEKRLNPQPFIQVRPHSSASTSDNTFIPDFYWLITVAAPSLLSTVFTIFRLKFVHVQHHQLVCAPTTAVLGKKTAGNNPTTELLRAAGQQRRGHPAPAQNKKGKKIKLGRLEF